MEHENQYLSYETISEKLLNNLIDRFYINGHDQISGDPDLQVSFITKDNEKYIVRAQYDTKTNLLLCPVSLINWINTYKIFNLVNTYKTFESAGNINNIINSEISKNYIDDEIFDKITSDYFKSIF